MTTASATKLAVLFSHSISGIILFLFRKGEEMCHSGIGGVKTQWTGQAEHKIWLWCKIHTYFHHAIIQLFDETIFIATIYMYILKIMNPACQCTGCMSNKNVWDT